MSDIGNEEIDEEDLDCPHDPSYRSYHESFEGFEEDSDSEYGSPSFFFPNGFFECDEKHVESSRPGGKLFSLIGRLEHIPIRDDFQLLLRSHPEVILPFMNNVGEELVKFAEKHPTRSGVQEMVDAFAFVKDNLEDVPLNFFTDPTIAWPMEVIVAVCNYLVSVECVQDALTVTRNGAVISVERNYTNIRELVVSGAILTIGKSLFASFAVSMAETKEELPCATAEMYVAAYDVGFAHRMVSRRHFPDEQSECFNLFIAGIGFPALTKLVKYVNEGFRHGSMSHASFSALEITTTYGPRSVVVSGHPIDIAKLKFVLRAYSDSQGARVFLGEIPLSCPQNHHKLNEWVFRELLTRWEVEGLHLDESRLKCTILSPATGRPWRANLFFSNSDFFQREVAYAVTCSSHVLQYGLQKVSKMDRLTWIGGRGIGIEQLLDWEKGKVHPADEHHFLFPLKQKTSEFGVRQTLKKMALINEAWNKSFPDRRRRLTTKSALQDAQLWCSYECYRRSRANVDNAFLDPYLDEVINLDIPLSPEPLSACSFCQNEIGEAIFMSPSFKKFFDKINIHIQVEPHHFCLVSNVTMLLELWDVATFLRSN